MKNYIRYFMMIMGLMLAISTTSTAQKTNTPGFGEEINTGPKIFEYKDTPDYVFIHHRVNFFKKLNQTQLEVLESFDYPKYTSSNDPVKLEYDILMYEKSIKAWEEENAVRMDEILQAMELSK